MVVMLEVRHVAIYDTYHMELPKVGTGVDLLGRLSEDDWREIAAANMQLGGEREAVALGDVERIMRTDEIEGERARVIGYRQTEDGSYDLCAVEGVVDMVASLEIDPDNPAPFVTYTNEMAALCVRTVQNDVATDYYFPIDRQAIMTSELLPDASDIPRHIRNLRHYVNKTEEIVEENDIQDAESRRELMNDLNTVLSEMAYGTGVRVKCKAYSRRVGANECGVDVDADRQVLFGDLPTFAWRGNRPVLEMFDEEDRSVLFRVDVKDILDIMPTDEGGAEDGTDLFETVFNEDFQRLAWRLATDLAYTDEANFSDTLREYVQTLSDTLSYIELDAVSLAGFVLAPNDTDDNLKPEFIDSDRAYVDGVDFVKYDGTIHAVLEVVISDQFSDSSRSVYAIPSRDKLLRFENLNDDAQDLEFAVKTLHDIAQDMSEIFKSDAFYGFSLEEQLEILKQYDDEAYNALETINDPREFSGECTVMAYRCLPGSLLNVVSWNDVPLQEVGDGDSMEPFTLRADQLTVWNPELNNPLGLDGSLQKATDLPLSFGEPVLMAGNREEDVFYLLRARDIIGLSRGNPRNIS